MIQFGNNVSPDTETKTRRHWKPNILTKSLYSVALRKRIKIRLTSKVLKTMDREGGLDEYLLKESEARIKELGPMGWALRWTLMQTPEVIARFRAEAAAIGLAQEVIDKQWPIRPVSKDKSKLIRRQRERTQRKQDGISNQKMKARVDDDRVRAEKHRWFTAFSRRLQNERFAPTLKVAKSVIPQAATADAEKMMRLIRTFGEPTARAFVYAEKTGEVEKAGGATVWLGQYKARLAFQRLKARKFATARTRSGELTEEPVIQKNEAESKDAWGDLIKANKQQPQA
jgi:ribosomal protein L28